VQQQGGNWVATLVPFAIIAVVFALRMRSMRSERPLKLGSLWAVPVIYAAIAASTLVALPPPPIGWGLVIVGLALGIAVGWYRGKFIHIHRDSETGELRQRASPLAMMLLLAIVVLKLGARQVFGATAASQPGSTALLLTDAFIGFALGLLSATRLELYLRARRLPAAA
jgi:hypothetical protein